MSSTLEDELTTAAKFDGSKYTDRQNYLASLLRAIDKNVTPEGYDALTDEAVEWHHAAVDAMDHRKDIPEFPDYEPDPITDADEPVDEPPVEEPPRRPKRSERVIPDYANLDPEKKDRFGITVGTKTSMAVAMYEKGCTAKDILDALGGRFYNILKQLAKEGHKVIKDEDTKVWQLIHKDDVPKGEADGQSDGN